MKEHKQDEHENMTMRQRDHEHAHGGIFGEKTELIFAIICGALLGIGFGLSFVKDISSIIFLLVFILEPISLVVFTQLKKQLRALVKEILR